VSERKGVRLTTDEIVSYLKRTQLPTVLVEGPDDLTIYRNIEDQLGQGQYDVLMCHGRDTLLEVFQRDREFRESPVIYMADLDMWLFTEVPKEYRDGIVFTNGYSIENDIYDPAILESLMSTAERARHSNLVAELSKWFACEVERFRSHGYSLCDQNVARILTDDKLCPNFIQSYGYHEADPDLIANIQENYSDRLRGKTLMQILVEILSESSRPSKYSRNNLLEMSSRLSSAPAKRLHDRLVAALSHSLVTHVTQLARADRRAPVGCERRRRRVA